MYTLNIVLTSAGKSFHVYFPALLSTCNFKWAMSCQYEDQYKTKQKFEGFAKPISFLMSSNAANIHKGLLDVFDELCFCLYKVTGYQIFLNT